MEAPILIGEVELAAPIAPIPLPERAGAPAYNGVHALVRLRHVPVGYAFLRPDALDPAAIARQVWEQLAAAISGHCRQAGLPAVGGLPLAGLPLAGAAEDGSAGCPPVSVVVCTRNRPDSVMVTLRSLLAVRYRQFEVVLVDNAPSSDATRDAVLARYGEDPRVRYVREPRPGLSRAQPRAHGGRGRHRGLHRR
jgi:hypothetical protein